jgi:glycosyltransferase involved in cell wall biosynthesis
MVGDGEMRVAVESAAASAGIAGRLHLLGWRRDVPRLLAAFDVVALTSLWEGLPRVVPEAIAAGRPIVATAVDGTAEILRDGDNALLAEAGDVEGIATRLGRILDQPALGAALVDRARPLLAEFDIDAMVRSQEALYGRLLKRHPTRHLEAGQRAA